MIDANQQQLKAFRARSAAIDSSRTVQDAAILTARGHVLEIGPFRQLRRHLDGIEITVLDGSVLPALIDCYCRLEQPSQPPASETMAEWLRRSWEHDRSTNAGDCLANLRAGISRCLGGGVSCVGDVVGGEFISAGLPREPLRHLLMFRFSGWTDEDAATAAQGVLKRLSRVFRTGQAMAGLSPESAYLVSPRLLSWTSETALRRDVPVLTRCLEGPEEEEFLIHNRGELAAMLSSTGRLPSDWAAPGISSLDFLRSNLPLSRRCLLANTNSADEDSVEAIAMGAASVVYTPLRRWPQDCWKIGPERWTSAGVRLCLATGLACTDDSPDLLQLLRRTSREHPGIDPRTWMRSVTEFPAEALGLGSRAGRLEPGCFADFIVLQDARGTPGEMLLDDSAELAAMYIGANKMTD